ncbi:MAG: hypothetical protein Q9M92_16745 [Enterobacterales bacterium]|nr:hypothetical protein [Enterobacterales bacterium]
MAIKRPNKSFILIFLLNLSYFIFLGLGSSVAANNQHALKIGFGSCANQNKAQPIWSTILAHKPSLFISMGDNVYIDSSDPVKMQLAYDKLAAIPEYQNFTQQVPLMATWDDHDYGDGDGGKEFSGKYAAKKAFKAFFQYPEVQAIKEGDIGVFQSRWIGLQKKTHPYYYS